MQRRGGDSDYIKPIVFGVIAGAAVTFAGLLIFAVILTAGDMSDSVSVPFSLVSAALGALAGGWISARLCGRQGLAVGAVTGGVLFLINLLASVAASSGGVTSLTLAKLAVIVLSSAVGGVAGVNKAHKRKIN